MNSIVPLNKIKHDPQELLYYFPSMHPVRYTRLSNDYHFWRQVQAAEKVAGICGRILIPASCLHWKRKLLFAERLIRIKRSVFYVLDPDEMTEVERKKYDEIKEGRTG